MVGGVQCVTVECEEKLDGDEGRALVAVDEGVVAGKTETVRGRQGGGVGLTVGRQVLGAGEGWARSILFNPALAEQFAAFFARRDSFALGICNGCQMLAALAVWDKASIAAAMKTTLTAHGLKMPQLAPAVRVLVCGRSQTPSIDAVLALFDREVVLQRMASA